MSRIQMMDAEDDRKDREHWQRKFGWNQYRRADEHARRVAARTGESIAGLRHRLLSDAQHEIIDDHEWDALLLEAYNEDIYRQSEIEHARQLKIKQQRIEEERKQQAAEDLKRRQAQAAEQRWQAERKKQAAEAARQRAAEEEQRQQAARKRSLGTPFDWNS